VSIETAIRSALVNNPNVSALIGARVYPMFLPMGYTLPAISYQRITGGRPREMSDKTGRVNAHFQVDCWAESYSGAHDLSGKVITCLDNHRGTLGAGTAAMDDVGTIETIAERDDYSTDVEIYRVILEFLIPYKEE
jgi:hypothetical protein